jgi:uncharacterized protein
LPDWKDLTQASCQKEDTYNFGYNLKINMFKIVVDADSCPVKPDIFRVAERYDLKVMLVANSAIACPVENWIEVKLVNDHLDAADDWIVENVKRNDIVVTTDIPLASRSMKAGARVISPRGLVFTESSVANALATRDLMTHLRDIGLATEGPPAFSRKDHSKFLQSLDGLIQSIRKG